MLSRGAAVAQLGPRRKAVLDGRSTIKGPGRFTMLTHLRHDLAEMDLAELEQTLESLGHPRFHARQLFQWVHKRGVTDFGDMTDLGRELRASLAASFRVITPELVRKETSADGTTKFLLRLEDGQLIE